AGIRDDLVTGVQTCALPIFIPPAPGPPDGLPEAGAEPPPGDAVVPAAAQQAGDLPKRLELLQKQIDVQQKMIELLRQQMKKQGKIGRASCRERVKRPVVIVG